MDETLLDNPVWHALSGPHAALGAQFGTARRYMPDVAPFVSLEAMRVDRLRELTPALTAAGPGAILTLDPVAAVEAGPVVDRAALVLQMIARQFRPFARPAAYRPLGLADVPEMLDLVALTHPGPFGRRTIEMGRYIGIEAGGKLIAMAGERMRLPGFTEVSAVCVHPDHRGQGYAKVLVSAVAEAIVARGETPFLHSYPDNRPAIATYEALGFTGRRQLHFTLLRAG